jgi:hypothetical protein
MYKTTKNKQIYPYPSQKERGNKCLLKINKVAIKEKLKIKPTFISKEAKLFCNNCSLFWSILKEDWLN